MGLQGVHSGDRNTRGRRSCKTEAPRRSQGIGRPFCLVTFLLLQLRLDNASGHVRAVAVEDIHAPTPSFQDPVPFRQYHRSNRHAGLVRLVDDSLVYRETGRMGIIEIPSGGPPEIFGQRFSDTGDR